MTDARGAISAYIICKNEAEFIGDCLASLDGFAEIVVVDSGSTDGTLDIIHAVEARGLPIRLIANPWPGFAQQKQFALDACKNAWCLNLDADERLSSELAKTIASLDLSKTEPDGYRIAFAQYVVGYGYTPESVHVKAQLRLVRKAAARYDLTIQLHEGLTVTGKVEPLKGGRVLHFRNLSIGTEAAKAGGYATLKARANLAKERRATAASIIFNPVGRVLKSYVLQRYFLCGVPGLVYSLMLGLYVFLAEAKLYRMQSGKDAPPE